MTPSSLSGEEIVRIIDACAKRRVVKLKLGELEVDFNPLPTAQKAPGPATPAPASPQVLAEQINEQQRALDAEEISTREEQLAELALTNPAEYERMIENGEIEIAQEEHDGDSFDNGTG